MVTGFRLVGIEGVIVSSADEAWQALSKAVEHVDVAVVIISQQFSAKMRNRINKLRSSRISPLIVEIPGNLGPPEAIDILDIARKIVGVSL